MTFQSDNYADAEQLQARHVGDSPSGHAQQPAALEGAARADSEIDQLVERVRWLMRREPTLDREARPM